MYPSIGSNSRVNQNQGFQVTEKAPPKYIFTNGIKKINPAYKQFQQAQSASQSFKTPVVQNTENALAIISSMDDVDRAAQAQGGLDIQIAESTASSIEIIQDEDYVQKFNSNSVDGGQIIDGLGAIFEKYEVPIGLVNKLLVLSEYHLNFIVDNSGSMTLDSDVKVPNSNRMLTRWQEAEQRLKQFMQVLSYVPCESIKIRFLNRPNVIELEHSNTTPERFQQNAVRQIENAFRQGPRGGTPTLRILQQAFQPNYQSAEKTAHYLMTDGVPNEGSTAVGNLVKNRANPQKRPLHNRVNSWIM